MLRACLLGKGAHLGLVGRSKEALDTERLDELGIVGDGLLKFVISMFSPSSTVGAGCVDKGLLRHLEDGGSVLDDGWVAFRAGVMGRSATAAAAGNGGFDDMPGLRGAIAVL